MNGTEKVKTTYWNIKYVIVLWIPITEIWHAILIWHTNMERALLTKISTYIRPNIKRNEKWTLKKLLRTLNNKQLLIQYSTSLINWINPIEKVISIYKNKTVNNNKIIKKIILSDKGFVKVSRGFTSKTKNN